MGAHVVKSRKQVAVGIVSLLALVVVVNVGLWVRWAHGTTIITASNGARGDLLVAEVKRLPIKRDLISMYSSLFTGSHCYQVLVFLEPRGGPALTSACYSFDSVEPDESSIDANWPDRDTLHIEFDDLAAVEVVVDVYGEYAWRRLAGS